MCVCALFSLSGYDQHMEEERLEAERREEELRRKQKR